LGLDGLVNLFDKLLADTKAKARRRLVGEYPQSVAVAANDKVLLLAEIAWVLLYPDFDDRSRVGGLFQAVPKDRLADCDRIARPADDSTSTCLATTTRGSARASSRTT
jgi:hypothetical protein